MFMHRKERLEFRSPGLGVANGLAGVAGQEWRRETPEAHQAGDAEAFFYYRWSLPCLFKVQHSLFGP